MVLRGAEPALGAGEAGSAVLRARLLHPPATRGLCLAAGASLLAGLAIAAKVAALSQHGGGGAGAPIAGWDADGRESGVVRALGAWRARLAVVGRGGEDLDRVGALEQVEVLLAERADDGAALTTEGVRARDALALAGVGGVRACGTLAAGAAADARGGAGLTALALGEAGRGGEMAGLTRLARLVADRARRRARRAGGAKLARGARSGAAGRAEAARGAGLPDHARGGSLHLAVAARRAGLARRLAHRGGVAPGAAGVALGGAGARLELPRGARDAAVAARRPARRHARPCGARRRVCRPLLAEVAFRALPAAGGAAQVGLVPEEAGGAVEALEVAGEGLRAVAARARHVLPSLADPSDARLGADGRLADIALEARGDDGGADAVCVLGGVLDRGAALVSLVELKDGVADLESLRLLGKEPAAALPRLAARDRHPLEVEPAAIQRGDAAAVPDGEGVADGDAAKDRRGALDQKGAALAPSRWCRLFALTPLRAAVDEGDVALQREVAAV
mmetsp:Transcript_47154/g.153038  ORF Transcript_47154/g.153038 Transcript_47154/m.153038 type:complete len:510 (+) Transcript_47154:795-2324(+)